MREGFRQMTLGHEARSLSDFGFKTRALNGVHEMLSMRLNFIENNNILKEVDRSASFDHWERPRAAASDNKGILLDDTGNQLCLSSSDIEHYTQCD